MRMIAQSGYIEKEENWGLETAVKQRRKLLLQTRNQSRTRKETSCRTRPEKKTKGRSTNCQ